SMVAPETVVADHRCLYRIQQNPFRVHGYQAVHYRPVWMPETVATPRVERTVVTRFQHRLENVVVFDDMAAPGTVADIDSSTRHLINCIMAHTDAGSQLDLYPCHLFFNRTDVADEVVFRDAIRRVCLALRAGDGIYLVG